MRLNAFPRFTPNAAPKQDVLRFVVRAMRDSADTWERVGDRLEEMGVPVEAGTVALIQVMQEDGYPRNAIVSATLHCLRRKLRKRNFHLATGMVEESNLHLRKRLSRWLPGLFRSLLAGGLDAKTLSLLEGVMAQEIGSGSNHAFQALRATVHGAAEHGCQDRQPLAKRCG